MMTRRSILLAAGVIAVPPIERRVFDAVNFQRVCKYSDPLVWDDRLAVLARQHCDRMLARGFFGHDDPDFGNIDERLNRARIGWQFCGENLFRATNYDDPVSIAIVEWMYSPGHRRNLLDPNYTTTGVGFASGSEGRIVITQNFIRPR